MGEKGLLLSHPSSLGGGDSFAGGLIYALLNARLRRKPSSLPWLPAPSSTPFPAIINLVTLKEVEALVAGDGAGRVQR